MPFSYPKYIVVDNIKAIERLCHAKRYINVTTERLSDHNILSKKFWTVFGK